MLQLALTIIIFLIIVIPVGRYMYHIATWNHTLADPVFDRLDGVIYKIGGVNPHQGMTGDSTLWLWWEPTRSWWPSAT